jgi:flagellin-like hook-associated protein FlgL
MTTINTNTSAILARTFAMQASDRQRTSMERLSSGLRINSSADDAAGLAVSTKMQSQLTSMNSALRNSMDGVSLIQTAMSSMSTITNIVQRMRELSVQMHNGVYTNSDRENAQLEIRQLLGSISQIAETTAFNNVLLLDGSYQNKIRAGHTNSEVIDLLIDGMGILPYIKGNSYASSLASSTILRPITSANGTSLLDYLASSFASGTSVLDIINQSNATGTSKFQTRAVDTATGNSNIDILSNASPVGTSIFNTPLSSSGSGTSQIDRLANVSGAGSSIFRVPNASNASGASQLDLLNNNAASGASNFNTASASDASGSSLLNLLTNDVAVGSSSFDLPANSRAAGSSQVDLLATNSAAGSSAFNTPPSSTANGSTNLDIANATFGTNTSSADTAANSTANGLSGRSILPNATASGTSYLNTLSTSTPVSSSSAIAGLAPSSVANVTSASQITPLLFENGNFQYGGSGTSNGSGTSSIPGWNIVLEQVNLGDPGQPVTNLIKVNNTTIAAPSDQGGPNDNQRVLSDNGNPTTFKFNASNGQISLGTNSVKTSTPNAAMHGPYLTSKNPYALAAGDQVYFDWGVKANGDAADVYAFLVDTSTNQTIELLNYQQTAPGSKGFTRNTTTINTAGNYNFVFVSGSFDADGGTVLGSELLLKNVGITQANPSSAAISTSAVTLSAQESNSVSISNLKMAELYKKAQADGFNGNFEILPRGSDYSNFSIDRNTGNITSTTLRQTNKSTYSFDVRYIKAGGSGHHTESVTLNLTATERASSNISMQEGSTLVIERTNLSLLNNYVNANGAGTFRFSSNSPDANKFNIDANTGRITSRYPLDFDVQRNYSFDIIFRKSSDGSEFVNSVALTLTDTLDSVAVLTSEESDRVSIPNTSIKYNSSILQRGSTKRYVQYLQLW